MMWKGRVAATRDSIGLSAPVAGVRRRRTASVNMPGSPRSRRSKKKGSLARKAVATPEFRGKDVVMEE